MHMLICLSDFSLSANRLYVNKGQELKSSQCHTYITNNGLVYMNVIHTFVEERRLKGNAFISYYDKCLILLTNFVALLWTFSITIISFFFSRVDRGLTVRLLLLQRFRVGLLLSTRLVSSQ